MRRFLFYFFVLFLALDLAALVLLFQTAEATALSGVLIDVRNAVFSKFVAQPSELEAPPAEFIERGFLTDSAEERAKWREILDNLVRYHDMFQQVEKASSTVEKAKLVTLSFSRNGAAATDNSNLSRLYTKNADLLFKICTIMEPRGLCSDHAQVFTALASVAGLDAVVVNCAHTTCAFYCPECKKWVWIDPEFALMAKLPNGEYMSPLEIRDANLHGKPINYDFFGTTDHLFAHTDPRSSEIYDPKKFCPLFGMEWGNNEFTRNKYDHRFLFLPKSVRQVVSILCGLHPTYRFLDDDPLIVAKYYRIRIISYLVLFLFIVGNLGYPLYCLIDAIRRRFAAGKTALASLSYPQISLEAAGQNITG